MKAIKIVGELLVPSLTEEGNGGGKSREVETRAIYTLLEVNIFSVPILFRDRIERRVRLSKRSPVSSFLRTRDRSTASNKLCRLLALVPY